MADKPGQLGGMAYDSLGSKCGLLQECGGRLDGVLWNILIGACQIHRERRRIGGCSAILENSRFQLYMQSTGKGNSLSLMSLKSNQCYQQLQPAILPSFTLTEEEHPRIMQGDWFAHVSHTTGQD